MKKLVICVLCIALLLSGCIQSETNPQNNELKYENFEETFIGTWINYNEISELVKNVKNIEELKIKINNILDILIKFQVNNIFLHIRAFDDALYNSDIYNQSLYACNSDNEFFDVLSAFITCAHSKDIKVHAWINPFRISNQPDISKINSNSLANKIYSENNESEKLIICENGIYYNPIILDVQKYVLTGIREIIDNYDVDGIHFDDYFYPTTDKKIDEKFYAEYCSSGGEPTIEDMRREAVNTFISSVYSLCKSNELTFSISPSADIDKNYNEKYADIKKWVTTSGYADYIIPQIYFGFEHETMPFDECIDEWKNLNSKVKIAVGIPIYKAGKTDLYAKTGSDEWIQNNDILIRQIQYINQKKFDGYVFYSASYLYNDYDEVRLEKENILKNN